MKRPRILVLCSGEGGESEAFVQAGYDVVRIEIDPGLSHVPHTLTLDVLDWCDWIDRLGDFQIVIATPPCGDFSHGYNAPKAKAAREGKLDEYEPDMQPLLACLDIIDYVKPTWWLVENVAGSTRYFTPILGKFTQHIGPFFLWGTFPHLRVASFDHAKVGMNTARERQKWPFELSFALLDAVREQWTLQRWGVKP